MKRLWFVFVLLSSASTLCAQSTPEDRPSADNGDWTTVVMPADGGDNGDKSGADDTGSKEEPLISVKIVEDKAPKKGKPKVKAVKTAKGKPRVKAAVPAAPPGPAAAPEAPPVPAVPLTPIAPRNP